MSGAKAQWEAAYRSAEYRVLLPAGDLVLRVGEHDAEHDRRLRMECGVHQHWAVLTPCNPGSRVLETEDNQRRLSQLAALLQQRKLYYHPTMNRDPAARWPDEPGVLLCDPLPGYAEELGRLFAQNAILIGILGKAPQLLWLDPDG